MLQKQLLSLLAMGDELATLKGATYEFSETNHALQLREGCLLRLLHGTYQDFLQTGWLNLFAFRETAVETGDGIDANLRRLLDKPLRTVDVLGWCDGYVEMEVPKRRRLPLFDDFKHAVLRVSLRQNGTIKRALAICQQDLSPFAKTQNTDTVGSFLVW